MYFFDTNILVYAQTTGEKRGVALDILLAGGAVSVQVLNEFIHVLRRKLKRTWPEIDEVLHDLDQTLPAPFPLTRNDQRLATQLSRDHQISIYDAMIIAVANGNGCTRIYTEDLQHEQRFGITQIVNPFI